jgi:hypothetical protein
VVTADNSTNKQARRRAARSAEQLIILSLAIICAAFGFPFHVLWIAAIVLMALLWGYMASEIGSARRHGGVVSDVVTTIADEARDLTREVSNNGSASEPEATKQELYNEARDAGIEGRSKMTKDELQRALGDEEGC